jgi:O-antigen/teichoic acid export membrane protein
MGYLALAFKGISWMAALRAVTRGLAVVRIAILARILKPAQFGIFGIATLVLGFLETLTETGINIFLIQEKEKIDEYIDSAWVVSVLRGILIGVGIAIFAPYIAEFFQNPSARNILYLVAIVPVVRGLINPACIKFQKDLEFKKQFSYDSVLFLVEAVSAVVLGVITKSENSLVWALIISALLEVVLSFIVFKPRPRFMAEGIKIKRIINRGKWITGAGVFNYLFQNLDDIFVGRILGAGSLGIYQQAYKISTLPVSEVGEIFNKVTFPIYATIEGDKKRLRDSFLKTLAVILLLVIPFGILVFKFPVQIVSLVLGSAWLAAAPILQVLAIFGVLKAIFNSFFSLFLGIGKQEVVTYATLASTVVMAILIYPFIQIYGILGAAFAAIISTLVSFPVLIYFFWKHFK